SIKVTGTVLTATEKTVNDDQVMELKVRIPSKELEGKRDGFAKVLKGTMQLTFVPGQTELDLDGKGKEADGQTELPVEGE
ncbi:hypothetical protein, partial [Lacticaseibacillus absianus]|uniref:hypothetical protein n=1 Tax=Lacticaseibacillus absianus TaxID=2729623 RepID=UPI0015C9FA3B